MLTTMKVSIFAPFGSSENPNSQTMPPVSNPAPTTA